MPMSQFLLPYATLCEFLMALKIRFSVGAGALGIVSSFQKPWVILDPSLKLGPPVLEAF